MINDEQTLDMFGYESKDLSFGSAKKVIAICEECGKTRVIRFQSYHDLCHSCAMKKRTGKNHQMFGKHHTEETKQKIRDNHADQSGENNGMYGKTGSDHPCFGRKRTIEERKKISDSRTGIVFSKEHLRNMSITQKGRHHTEESKQKIRLNMNNRVGENNPNWNGGTSFGEYCPKFNEVVKRNVREKYNNCDFISGLHSSICNGGKRLCVHHVDYNKMQGCDGHEWRLIPLSQSNHSRTSGKKLRFFWNRLLIYAIDYDKECYNKTGIAGLLM